MARRLHVTMGPGRQKALGGLAWRDTPGDSPAEIREQVRAAAEAFRSRFGAMVDAARAEVGMVPEIAQREGRGGISAAAWLAAASPEPTLFIEPLANGTYWVVHTAAGYVDPRTDEVCNEDEARSIVDSILDTLAYGEQTVRVVVAGDRKPASVMLDRQPEIVQRSFADLVHGIAPPPSARIRQLVGVTPGTLAAIFALLALAGAGWAGYMLYQQHVARLAFEANRAALARQNAEAERLKNEEELRMLEAVNRAATEDTATVAPDQVLRTCLARTLDLGGAVGGWVITQSECSTAGDSVKLTVRAPSGTGIGTAGTLLRSAEDRGLKAVIAPQSNTATLTMPLQGPPVREGLTPTQLPAYQPILRSLLSRLQLARSGTEAITYTMHAPTPRPVVYIKPGMEQSQAPERIAQVPPERTFLKGKLHVQGKGAWAAQALSFDDYPFVTLTRATIAVGSAGINWNLEADYVSSR